MKLIGVKRALILAILLAVNLAIAAVYFLQIEPMKADAQSKLNNVNSQITSQSQKIANIKADLQTFHDTLPKFQALADKGFMLQQDRFRMTRDLDAVRAKANLASFSFTINDIKRIPDNDAEGAQMQLIDSRINIDNVVSLLDINVYDFVGRMITDFPTHVRVQSFEISRKTPLDAVSLGHIRNGDAVNLISAKATFDWLTMVPKQDQAPNTPGGL
jgi:hypothetical protein